MDKKQILKIVRENKQNIENSLYNKTQENFTIFIFDNSIHFDVAINHNSKNISSKPKGLISFDDYKYIISDVLRTYEIFIYSDTIKTKGYIHKKVVSLSYQTQI